MTEETNADFPSFQVEAVDPSTEEYSELLHRPKDDVKDPSEQAQETVAFKIDRETLLAKASADGIFIAERIASFPEDIQLKPGIQLLVGPNGSGKSTLLSAMYYRAEEHYLGEKPKVSDSELLRTSFRRSIADAVHLDPEAQFDIAIYYDGAESDPRVKHAARQQANLGADMERQMLNKIFAGQRKESSRESKDSILNELSEFLEALHREGKKVLLFIDEFENGLDPRRHMRIREILEKLAGPEDTVFISTNSPILFEEKLPRLDFTFPEKGMPFLNPY
jgi:predicted ATPase